MRKSKFICSNKWKRFANYFFIDIHHIIPENNRCSKIDNSLKKNTEKNINYDVIQCHKMESK